MRKIILCFVLSLVVGIVTSCSSNNPDSDIEINIGASSQFTEGEIAEAIACVIEQFSFPACTLTQIEYNEETSNQYTKGYQENGMKAENVMVLLSDFEVDDSGDNPVLNSGTTYTEVQWILIRESKTSNWKIEDWGY